MPAIPRIAYLSHHATPDDLPPVDRAGWTWLAALEAYEADFVPFRKIERLQSCDAAWWSFSESRDLPAGAGGAVDAVRNFVERGGKLLLSLVAARYVGALGLDREPDAVEWAEERLFYWNGYVRKARHRIFEGLPKQFHVADIATLRPFSNARWLEEPPERGRVLAIATWGARFVEGERVVVEWDCGKGQVLAIGMHNFRFDGEPSANLARFAGNVLRYLAAPFVAELRLDAGEPAVPAVGYLGGRYADGGTVVTEGQDLRALVTGKAWRDREVAVRCVDAERIVALAAGERFSFEMPVSTRGAVPGEHEVTVALAEAALMQRYYVVPRSDGPVIDRHGTWELRSDDVVAELDKGTGCLWGLYDPSSDRPVQFAANADNLPALDTPNHRWLGDLSLRFRFEGDTAWRDWSTTAAPPGLEAGEDSVEAAHVPQNADEPLTPAIRSRFALDGGGLEWTLTIQNRSRRRLIIGEVAIPLALNTFFAGEVDLAEIYERKVVLHSFIAGASSWVLAAPFDGRPPYLVLWCKEGTRLEAMAHVDDYGERPEGWEGLVSVFPYSTASRETRCWYEWYNGHTFAVVPGGEELRLRFGLRFIRSYDEIAEALLDAGKVAVDVAPGMVLPTDMSAHLRVRSRRGFVVEGDERTRIEQRGQSLYRLRFREPGRRTVRIVDDRGEVTYLHYLATEPIQKLARARARHIVEKHQVKGRGWRDGMFLMWDAEEERILDDPRMDFMCGGSDEIGFAEALTLAWKNVVDPEPAEIAALEYYVQHFLYGRLQKPDTYEVASGLTGDPDEEIDYARSFNYPHVVSIYFALAEIARRYGLTHFRDDDGYLAMAYRTALTYFTKPMYKDNARTVGNMGEWVYFELVARLRETGHEAEADELARHVRRKAERMLAEAHPYLSEFPFDTTGYAGAYHLKKHAGGLEGAAPVVRMLRATRGRQPMWPWYGGDVRWGWGNSKYPWPDELCFNYMVAHNGRALLDHFHERGEIEDLRLGYGAYLSYWALLRPDGAAYNLYTWEPQRMTFDPWSSEMGCGLYMEFVMACSYVVDDPDFGLIGYGCDVDGDPTRRLAVVPCDGVAKRARISPLGLVIETDVSRIEELVVEGGGGGPRRGAEAASPPHAHRHGHRARPRRWHVPGLRKRTGSAASRPPRIGPRSARAAQAPGRAARPDRARLRREECP